jgi:hypothetical protein
MENQMSPAAKQIDEGKSAEVVAVARRGGPNGAVTTVLLTSPPIGAAP